MLTLPAAFRADREVGWNKPLRRRFRHRSKSSRSTVKKKATVSKGSITLAGKPSAARHKGTPAASAPLASKATTTKKLAAKASSSR